MKTLDIRRDVLVQATLALAQVALAQSADAALSTHLNLIVNVTCVALLTHWNLLEIWNQYGSLSADAALLTHSNFLANVAFAAFSTH